MALTDSQKEVAKNAFAIFAGKKGTLNKKELADVLRVLGFIPSPQQLPGGDSFDLNTTLQIAGSLKLPTEKDNDELAAAFRVFDRGGTGAIPAEEFVNQAKILGDGLNDIEAAELLKLAHDGKLNYKDLVNKMTAESK